MKKLPRPNNCAKELEMNWVHWGTNCLRERAH